jgi:hypothetical protein
MKAASLSEIKKEISLLPPQEIAELCLRLARYKKENKELLTYLLFEAADEIAFIDGIKQETDTFFAEINNANLYFAKKSIRKILRNINKHIRYSGKPETGAELLIYFCSALNNSGIDYKKSTALVNLYAAQIKKINKYIDSMHEDLQYDFRKQMKSLD